MLTLIIITNSYSWLDNLEYLTSIEIVQLLFWWKSVYLKVKCTNKIQQMQVCLL
jgi:hypothetical protein